MARGGRGEGGGLWQFVAGLCTTAWPCAAAGEALEVTRFEPGGVLLYLTDTRLLDVADSGS
jgi:hypothetical protein